MGLHGRWLGTQRGDWRLTAVCPTICFGIWGTRSWAACVNELPGHSIRQKPRPAFVTAVSISGCEAWLTASNTGCHQQRVDPSSIGFSGAGLLLIQGPVSVDDKRCVTKVIFDGPYRRARATMRGEWASLSGTGGIPVPYQSNTLNLIQLRTGSRRVPRRDPSCAFEHRDRSASETSETQEFVRFVTASGR